MPPPLTPLRRKRAGRAAQRRRARLRVVRRDRRRARGARLDSGARVPELPHDARHRDRRRVRDRDGVDHPGLELHDRPAVRGARQQQRHGAVVHRARGRAARAPRAAHGAGPRSHSVPRGRNRVDHADHVHAERPGPDPLRLADDDVAGARHDVLVSRRRASISRSAADSCPTATTRRAAASP